MRRYFVTCLIAGLPLAFMQLAESAIAAPIGASRDELPKVNVDPFATNKDVLTTCSAKEGTLQYSLCLGYIYGLLRRDELLRWTNPNLAYACELPQGVDADQLRAVIVKYLQDRPETWHWTGAGSSLYAVKRAFCRPNQ